MEKKIKKKMSNKVYRIIMIPIICVLVIFSVVLTTVTDYFTPSLDTFLGKGKKTATTPAGTKDWDTDYYDFASTNQEEALNNSIAIAEQIGDEGEVLLKNDGLLPLERSETVTPMGYRYINPVMSGSGSGSTNTSADYVYTPDKGLTEAFDNVNSSVADAMKKGHLSILYQQLEMVKAVRQHFLAHL